MNLVERNSTLANKRKDAAARRAVASLDPDLILRKSRRRTWSLDDQCGYMIVDPHLNIPVAGFRCDLTADDVLSWCQKQVR